LTLATSIVNFIEELLFRWLPLGLIAKITFFSSIFWFYILFLAGNLIWSLMHLGNFNKKDRQLIRVFPIFILGIFLTYIFVKYGLLASAVTHITYNIIIFTTLYYTKQKMKRA
ncbi:CPBP family intramembrane metalloprotease, partial [Patescibacteria group bacterium]|nr:CPBP family intramembrane metalloprotease [Patescibacteria group bacterium]